jgi:hypothetical protein
MRKRTTLSAAILAAAVLMLGLLAPVGASASVHSRVAVRGGNTTLTTAPGLVTSLLGAKIVALVTAPGTQTLIGVPAAPRLVATYPVAGGNVTPTPLGGRIGHRGGLFITNVSNGKSVAVNNFVINLNNRTLTAHIVGLAPTARVAVFSLNLSHRLVTVRPRFISISRIGVSLLASAAGLLNSTLGTKAFKGGLLFGTASSRLNR